LDVHKKTIAVATVEGCASASVRFYGTIANTPAAIQSLLKKLRKGGRRLHLAYEAGPMGYNLYRLSTGLGHRCDVVARSLIPRKAGDRVKTDRRDAMTLAQTLRAGQLTEVWVPDEAHEAMREPLDVLFARLRHQEQSEDKTDSRHRDWVDERVGETAGRLEGGSGRRTAVARPLRRPS
jgi:transposase